MARPGIEPRASDLRVRCPTDCATRPGQMHAELNDLKSHLNNKQIAHTFDFLHLHRRVPVKYFVVAHENVRLSIGMFGI